MQLLTNKVTICLLLLLCSPRMASGMQDKQYTPSLLSFFIYNPTFGPREGEVLFNSRFHSILFISNLAVHGILLISFLFFQEEKKILFYHPNDVDKNEKIRNVGLCEAIVQFTR